MKTNPGKTKKKKRPLRIIFCVIAASLAVLFLLALKSGDLLLPVAKKEHFALSAPDAVFASKLHVDGTHLADESGSRVVLKGVMVPELNKIRSEKKLNRQFFDEVFAFGGNVVRIPVHPRDWEQDEYYLWRYLDPVVEWAVGSGRYVILDMHLIGNIRTGAGEQMPSSDAYKFAVGFWSRAAAYFKDVPNVLYEIYNEPALITSQKWADKAQELVEVIRSAGSDQVIIVGSIDYSFDLSYWRMHPLADKNVMYSAHIFPNRHGIKLLEQNASQLPVIVTEWGYIVRSEQASRTYLIGSRESYAIPMLETMSSHDISWVACWYDDGWEPPIFRKESSDLTEWGEFVRSALSN